MNEFIILLAKIMAVAFLQSLFETFVNLSKRPYLAKFVSAIFFLLCVYFLAAFVFDRLEIFQKLLKGVSN